MVEVPIMRIMHKRAIMLPTIRSSTFFHLFIALSYLNFAGSITIYFTVFRFQVYTRYTNPSGACIMVGYEYSSPSRSVVSRKGSRSNTRSQFMPSTERARLRGTRSPQFFPVGLYTINCRPSFKLTPSTPQFGLGSSVVSILLQVLPLSVDQFCDITLFFVLLNNCNFPSP